VKTRKLNSRSSRRCGVWGSGRLPQGGEAPLPLPRGLGGRCGRGRSGHRRNPSHLRGACCPSCRLPGGGCSRTRPRRYHLCRLRGSRRGGRGLPPLEESSSLITLLPLSRRRVFRCRWGRGPLLLAQSELLVSLLPALPPLNRLLFLACHPLLLPPLRRARPGSGRGRVTPRGVHGHHLQRASETSSHDDAQ
jgi:hypothetical protein